MTDKELLKYCQKSAEENGYLRIEEAVLQTISPEQAELIAKQFTGDTMMLLPDAEIKFFEWLKEVDFPVWLDLWGDPDYPPYIVTAFFLPMLLRGDGRGFPICDLVECDNYYFSMSHMPDEEAKVIIETSKTRFVKKEQLSAAHLLALEISFDPIDIWHFAYKHNIKLDTAKKAVAELVEDKALVHLTKSEHLSVFLEF